MYYIVFMHGCIIKLFHNIFSQILGFTGEMYLVSYIQVKPKLVTALPIGYRL